MQLALLYNRNDTFPQEMELQEPSPYYKKKGTIQQMWHPMISATVGASYRDIVEKYYDISVEDSISRERALGDFSFRGQESLQSAVKSSAGWCLSFYNTAKITKFMKLYNLFNFISLLTERST